MSGAVSYHSGLAAEDIVQRHRERSGQHLLARRWRGKGGEIDLVMRDGRTVVFVEVKRAKTLDEASCRLGRRQMDRLCIAAQEFVANLPTGLLTDMRFDLAAVDGAGQVRIIENAFEAA